jgi:hypothetical protein
MRFEDMVLILSGLSQHVVNLVEAEMQPDVTESRAYTKGVLTMKVEFQPK